MKCLWCHEALVNSVCWESIFGLSQEASLCSSCQTLLKPIVGEVCLKCGRSCDVEKCKDCATWENMEDWSGLLEKNRSLYHYNGHLKAIIAKWKYRGDTILVQIFAQPFRELAIKEFNNTEIVVPIPISTKRLYERTFNQAKLLAELLPFPNVEALILPVTQVKQSKKSRKQRLQLENNPFEVNKEVVESIKGKSILIVDDIYTTGATIYQAAKLLKDIGVNNICSITLARG